ncbi:MAG: VOC family protein, partial [Candidatus Brocadiia bacterium]|nr:VOC family protein [Candidatus Brocadiia bacterium]
LYLDHVLIAVRDLAAAGRAYSALGFKVTPEGRHPGRGTHNRLVVFGSNYLELIAIEDPAGPLLRPAMGPFLQSREGLFTFAMGADDIEATRAGLRGRGVTVSAPSDGERLAPDGTVAYSWRYASIERDDPAGSDTFVIQHHQAVSERYTEPAEPTLHANGVLGIHHLALAVCDAEKAASAWQRDFGLTRVSVGRAEGVLRVRLDLESAYLDLVSPLRAGPLSEFLERNGEAPYLLALEVDDISATASFLSTRGMPMIAETSGADGESLAVGPAYARGAPLRFLQAG